MKYVVVLGDGMADYPIEELNGKTPLSVANKPYIDGLAKKSKMGLCQTIANGMKPGSDVANLSILGYDTTKCYTGRSPLEAASIGIDLSDTDVTLRANLVTLSNEENYADKTMVDYSAGEISTEEAKELISYLKKYIDSDIYTLYSGVSYRHCLVVKNGKAEGGFTPPHDISDKKIKDFLPDRKEFLDLMIKSNQILSNHPINVKRAKEGKNVANSIWLWGEGTKPNLENFFNRTHLKAGMISAVDLLKGIAVLSGMRVIDVVGATGNYTTNFVGKAKACLENLKDLDFVYIHMEAPDECGHQGDLKHKIYSIEQIDNVVKIVCEGLKGTDYKMMICPDHPTPIALKTHVSTPIPFMIYDSTKEYNGRDRYDEENAGLTGEFVGSGVELMKMFLQK